MTLVWDPLRLGHGVRHGSLQLSWSQLGQNCVLQPLAGPGITFVASMPPSSSSPHELGIICEYFRDGAKSD